MLLLHYIAMGFQSLNMKFIEAFCALSYISKNADFSRKYQNNDIALSLKASRQHFWPANLIGKNRQYIYCTFM